MKGFPQSPDPCEEPDLVEQIDSGRTRRPMRPGPNGLHGIPPGPGMPAADPGMTRLNQLSQLTWRERQLAKIKPKPTPPPTPSGPVQALPPSMFDAPPPAGLQPNPDVYGFNRPESDYNDYILESTTVSSGEDTILPPVDDPELIKFQKELDRRYFNLKENRNDKKVTLL